MGLTEIIQMIPPPRKPIHAEPSDSRLESQRHYRDAIPACLNKYGQTYGSGYFESSDPAQSTITIFNPHDPAYIDNVETYCEIYTSLKDDSPEFYPYACFPDKDGLFPMGVTGGSTPCCVFYLLLTNDAEIYKVVFDDRITGHLEFPDVPLFDFIEDVLCHRIPGNIPAMADVRFVPQQLFFIGNSD